MATSEDLATDIDIVIAMWCQQRGVVGISWDDRCALRKLIYDLFVAENRRANTEAVRQPTTPPAVPPSTAAGVA